MHELPLFAAFDQFRLGEDFQVMRNGRGSDPSQTHQLPAREISIGGNGFKDPQSRLIRQRF